MRKAIFFLLFFIFTHSLVQPADIYVPDDYLKIQDAINASADGDTIIVRPGSYVENIDFNGKAIKVKSEMGAETTTIDGGKPTNPNIGCAVNFENGEGRESVLDGFSIRNGIGKQYTWGACGGGINCYYSSPTIKNNIIQNNDVGEDGGGIYCSSSSPIITDNTIINNTSFNGGGVCLVGSAGDLINNNITNNKSYYGGGLVCALDSTVIRNNMIHNNNAYYSGGGLRCTNSSFTTITMNIISNNSASSFGGGIYCEIYSGPKIVNNIIENNHASGSGSNGGGIYCHNSDIFIINNTITKNNSTDKGGGIYCKHKISGVFAEISNTILWGNYSLEGNEIYLADKAIFTIDHSNVKGGQASVYVEPGCTLNWNSGMINADPLFLDPANGDFHIPFNSPCRSAGDRNATNLPETDFEGDPRTGLFAFPDIGADEFHTHFYIRGSVSPGSSATGVIIGWPMTNPVMLISGSGILPTPQSTPYGEFWLMPPWDHRVHFNPMPDNGVRLINRVVSTGLPPGTQIPIQALVGTELSNLSIVEIE